MPGHGLQMASVAKREDPVSVSLRCLKVLELRGCGLRDEGSGTLPAAGVRRTGNRNQSDMPRLEPLCDVKTGHDWGRLWARAVRETPATAPRSSWQAGALRRGLEALLCF